MHPHFIKFSHIKSIYIQILVPFENSTNNFTMEFGDSVFCRQDITVADQGVGALPMVD